MGGGSDDPSSSSVSIYEKNLRHTKKKNMRWEVPQELSVLKMNSIINIFRLKQILIAGKSWSLANRFLDVMNQTLIDWVDQDLSVAARASRK